MWRKWTISNSSLELNVFFKPVNPESSTSSIPNLFCCPSCCGYISSLHHTCPALLISRTCTAFLTSRSGCKAAISAIKPCFIQQLCRSWVLHQNPGICRFYVVWYETLWVFYFFEIGKIVFISVPNKILWGELKKVKGVEILYFCMFFIKTWKRNLVINPIHFQLISEYIK